MGYFFNEDMKLGVGGRWKGKVMGEYDQNIVYACMIFSKNKNILLFKII